MSDIILISKVGLYETIRCTICENPKQTERGCDGACKYDKELHAKIVEAVTGLAEQRPHGEWICKGSVGDGTWCSVCDTNIKLFPNRYSFCPNCGADMREGDSDA